MNTQHMTPLAIVVGATVIAIAIYLGIRENTRTDSEIGAVAPTPSAPSPAAPAARRASSADARGVAAQIDLEKLRQEVHTALEIEKKERLIPKCWTPALAKAPAPRSSTYRLAVSINAAGVEVARGISEVRDEPSRPDVADCLRNQPIGLKVAPLGAPTSLELKLSFP